MFGRGAASQGISPHSSRVPLQTPPLPWRPPAPVPRLALADFGGPKAPLPQQRRGHGTSARVRRNYKPRQPPRKARPLPPPPKTSPRTLRETPGLEIEQNRLMGEGGRRGSRRTQGKDCPLVLKTRSGLRSTPICPPPAGRGDRGPSSAPPGSGGRCPPGFLADSCQEVRSLLARRPPHALPLILAQTSGSGSAAASLSKADADTPLTSRFPEAPGADCFRSAGPRRRREAKPRVAMEMCSGRGRGGATTMIALRLRLASGLCSERPGFCVPPPRRGRERENSAVKIVFTAPRAVSREALSNPLKGVMQARICECSLRCTRHLYCHFHDSSVAVRTFIIPVSQLREIIEAQVDNWSRAPN